MKFKFTGPEGQNGRNFHLAGSDPVWISRAGTEVEKPVADKLERLIATAKKHNRDPEFAKVK